MKVYLTSGTFDFLKIIKDKHPNEKIILMQNNENSVLLHETPGKTVFNVPRIYEVINTSGTFAGAQFVALTNIPVTDEDRPLFEYRFTNNGNLFNNLPGLIAFRVLRPLKSNMYIIITFWKNEVAFKDWEDSQSYKKYFSQISSSSAQTQIFMGSTYTSKYYIPEET